MKTKGTLKFIRYFCISFLLFLAFSIPFRANLSIAAVSDVRIAAVLNPVLGLAYGWPAALGCVFANFFADLYSGYGLAIAIMALIPQTLYGIIPYYLWKRLYPALSHRTRLDHPKKVIYYALVMALNSIVVGLSVGFFNYYATGSGFLSVTVFAALNDFTICMIAGMPIMAFLDFLYNHFVHSGKRRLSVNERIILITAAIQLVVFILTIRIMYGINPELSLALLWEDIFTITNIAVSAIWLVSLLVMFLFHGQKEKQGLRIIRKNRGTIFVDKNKRLEFVSMAAPPLEDKVKADFWGYTDENIRKKAIRPSFETAWYTMISNQKGCPMACVFCDCPPYGFHGNVSRAEFNYQIETILTDNPATETRYFEVDFMRMGEPTLNRDILDFIEFDLKALVDKHINADIVYPYVSTMMPRANKKVTEYVLDFCRIKNEVYNGNAAIQFSINTTDEDVRNAVFNNRSMSLSDISEIAKKMPLPLGRKYALNFAVTKDSVIDASLIDSLFDKEKFLIKITPIHETFNAVDNGYEITSEYDSFDVFKGFEAAFLSLGWDVLIYLDTKEEDDDSLTCGNLLLPNE